ncbi:thioesterase II family protein [Hyphomonas pacifica]|nr:alpha/beta fold hydrolase [Hyphomonas pacifica]
MSIQNMSGQRTETPRPASWFFKPAPKPNASMRLFCFPCAGYGAAMYRNWQAQGPDWLEVIAVQPPGRANRLREAPLDNFDELIASILPQISELTDLPYAFFGHSMGAVFAAELASAMVQSGLPAPIHLFLSARQPPNLPSPVGPLSHLEDDAFVQEVNQRYGAIPREIIEAPEVLELLLPALRADIRALERIQNRQVRTLPSSITALGGTNDRLVPQPLLQGWESWTDQVFELRMFDGGHFYLDDQRAALILHISETLEAKSREGRKRTEA